MNQDLERIDVICRHIENVQRNCRLLGERLILSGEAQLGRMLIAKGLHHDASKLSGIEWDGLDYQNGEPNKEQLENAVHQHNTTNDHHPEFWGGIANMPRLAIAEMICDWKARSSEFGTALQDWIDGDAMERFGYKKDDEVYKQIQFFTAMLCEPEFVRLDTDVEFKPRKPARKPRRKN